VAAGWTRPGGLRREEGRRLDAISKRAAKAAMLVPLVCLSLSITPTPPSKPHIFFLLVVCVWSHIVILLTMVRISRLF
jgi:predicted MFS family arabinose efflux permease